MLCALAVVGIFGTMIWSVTQNIGALPNYLRNHTKSHGVALQKVAETGERLKAISLDELRTMVKAHHEEAIDILGIPYTVMIWGKELGDGRVGVAYSVSHTIGAGIWHVFGEGFFIGPNGTAKMEEKDLWEYGF